MLVVQRTLVVHCDRRSRTHECAHRSEKVQLLKDILTAKQSTGEPDSNTHVNAPAEDAFARADTLLLGEGDPEAEGASAESRWPPHPEVPKSSLKRWTTWRTLQKD